MFVIDPNKKNSPEDVVIKTTKRRQQNGINLFYLFIYLFTRFLYL